MKSKKDRYAFFAIAVLSLFTRATETAVTDFCPAAPAPSPAIGGAAQPGDTGISPAAAEQDAQALERLKAVVFVSCNGIE